MAGFTKKETEFLKKVLDMYVEEFYETLPSKEEQSKETFSPEFEAKMQKLINKQKKFYYYWINTATKRVAAVVLALLVSLATVTFSVKAIREPFIQFIVETFEKFSSIIFNNDEDDNQPALATVEFRKAVPEYIPEGFVVDSEIETVALCQVIYTNKSNSKIITYMQITKDSSVAQANTEDITYKEIKVNGYDGVSYNKNGNNSVIFNTEDYVFTISGEVEIAELIKIAESVKIN